MKKRSEIARVMIIALIACCVHLTNYDTVYAADNGRTLDILLKQDADIDSAIDMIGNIDSHINITEYSEINLIHLSLPQNITSDMITGNTKLQRYMDVCGKLPKLCAEPYDTVNIMELDDRDDEFKINQLAASQYYESKSSNSHSLNSQSTNSQNNKIFDALAWHVNEVTQSKNSFELSAGKGVKVALIDSGVDYDHPYLKGKINIGDGKSYVEGDESLVDRNSHGTMVAGIIAQIAPQATITPYKVLGDNTGESLWTIDAIIDAADDDVDIINLSVGTYKCQTKEEEKLIINAYERAIEHAKDNNKVVIASAGNESLDLDREKIEGNRIHLPGGNTDVLTISSTVGDSFADYSNYGNCIDLCAPGGNMVYVDGKVDINSLLYVLYPTDRDNGLTSIGIPQGYTFSYGTSFSSAIVSAGIADIIAYYKANNDSYKASDIEKIVMNGAKDIGERGKDRYFGCGKIDIYNSLANVENLSKR